MKKWIVKFLSIALFCLVCVGALNYWMDPFWVFNHSHKYNSIQKAVNERQQKTNYIYFTQNKFDTLLLGSSRTTYAHSSSFLPLNVFNYSASGMRPHEYLAFIDFAINDSKQPIENIIIAMDFFGYLDGALSKFRNPSDITNSTKMPYYRYKILFSFSSFNNSIKNLRDNLKNKIDDRYDRNLVRTRIQKENVEKEIKNDLEHYAKNAYAHTALANYKGLIKEIKNKYDDKKFIIYTTPISTPLFNKMLELEHIDNYKNWLRDLVEVFEEVHHFMYINSVTNDYNNYFADSNHAYPKTYDIVAKTVLQRKNIINDFGIILTKDNLEEFLSSF